MTGEDSDPLFAGEGELARLMRAHDWASSPLGPVATWPRSLRTCVRIALTSRQPMFVWWGEQNINLYNDAYRSIVGGKHPAALGQPAEVVWREIWDEEVKPRVMAAKRRNEGTYDESLLLIMERHGYQEETYYTFSYSPIPDDEGGIGGIFCANSDDTARIIGERRARLLGELATQSSESRNADEACRRSSAALASEDKDLPFTLLYRFEENATEARLVGTSGVERSHPLALDRVPLAGPSRWRFAELLERRDFQVVTDLSGLGRLPVGGWPKPPTIAVTVPIAAHGKSRMAGALVVGVNPYRQLDASYEDFLELLSAQISAALANGEAYERETQRAEALAELDRAKTTFFSNVSHELRTPLTLMLGPTEDALATPEGSLRGDALAMVHRNELRLLKLVNSLLDFARIEARRFEARFSETDVASLTVELASAFRSAVERAGLTLEVDCPPPPAGPGEPVFLAPELWEKIVLNLISNAYKFTFTGKIAVSLRWTESRVSLEVLDSGIGISPEELPRLFERFHRVDGARSRSFEGSGIGLALVQELVKMHGGEITAASELGKGTALTVTLPRGSSHLEAGRVDSAGPGATLRSTTGAEYFVAEAMRWGTDESGPRTESDRELAGLGEGAEPGTRGRVLVVDDNADMRDYLARLLGARHDVVTARDGAEALAAMERAVPELVVTDVMMPGLDGFEDLTETRSGAQA